MLKRMVLMVAVSAWLAMPAGRAFAQHESAGSAARDAAAAGQHTPQHSAEAIGEHEAQPPLLPDPTSRETVMSALWVVIIFIVLLAVLYPTAWRNVLIGLKKREQRIRQDIADAEAARKRAEATLKQYDDQLATAEEKVRELLAKAAADAEKIATSMRMQAQQEAEEIKERSQRDIEAARKAAIADIYAQAAELATSVAAKIIRRNLNPDDQRDLVEQSLKQVQAVGSGDGRGGQRS